MAHPTRFGVNLLKMITFQIYVLSFFIFNDLINLVIDVWV